MRLNVSTLFLVWAVSISTAGAQELEASTQAIHAGLRADVEVDPTAYALDGYSLHAGFGWNHLRIDLGVFAMAVPHAVHSQAGFDLSFDGYGVKTQWFLFQPQKGLFLGADGGLARALVKRQGTQLAARDMQFSLGINTGYRFDLWAGFYATPWIGLSYAVSAENVVLADATFKANPWTIFPAVHIGYHLR